MKIGITTWTVFRTYQLPSEYEFLAVLGGVIVKIMGVKTLKSAPKHRKLDLAQDMTDKNKS